MSKTVKVTYDSQSLKTKITVDGKDFVQSDSGKVFLKSAANFLGGYMEGRAQAKQYLESEEYYYDDEDEYDEY